MGVWFKSSNITENFYKMGQLLSPLLSSYNPFPFTRFLNPSTKNIDLNAHLQIVNPSFIYFKPPGSSAAWQPDSPTARQPDPYTAPSQANPFSPLQNFSQLNFISIFNHFSRCILTKAGIAQTSEKMFPFSPFCISFGLAWLAFVLRARLSKMNIN